MSSHVPRTPKWTYSWQFGVLLFWLGLLGCESSGTSDTTATSADTNDMPSCSEVKCLATPRWVLRDKDGEPVKALVEPRCGHWGVSPANDRCMPLDFGSPNSLPCVRIIDHDGTFVNLNYDLLSGTLEPCMQGIGSVADPLRDTGVIFLDAACEGAPYASIVAFGIGSDFTRSRDLIFADGDLWYVSEQGCPGLVMSYIWNPQTKTCVPLGNDNFVCPVLPVPVGIRGLLPTPPYTLGIEYQE